MHPDQIFHIDSQDLLDLYNEKLETEIGKIDEELEAYLNQPNRTEEGELEIYTRREAFVRGIKSNNHLIKVMSKGSMIIKFKAVE